MTRRTRKRIFLAGALIGLVIATAILAGLIHVIIVAHRTIMAN